MSEEGGFDFSRPGERREPKRFEPPPWERDAFDELEKRKQDEGTSQQPVSREQQAASAGPREVRIPEVVVGASMGDTRPRATVPRQEAQAVAPKPAALGVDEATLIELLAGLAAEEPPAKRSFFGVTMGAALLLLALGSVLLIWAIAALMSARRTGLTGTYAGAGLGVFGVGFIAGGMWLGYQALKRRGVL